MELDLPSESGAGAKRAGPARCALRIAPALALALAPVGASAEAFISRRAALDWAFPGAERIESRTVVLDDEQAQAVQRLARAPLPSRLVTIHTGLAGGRVLGHAFIDLHTVRTLPEAFMVVLGQDGRVRATRVLAFYEPREYLPPARWLAQFNRRALEPSLSLDEEIHGIAGATLSARAVTAGVRRALALRQVLLPNAADAAGAAGADE